MLAVVTTYKHYATVCLFCPTSRSSVQPSSWGNTGLTFVNKLYLKCLRCTALPYRTTSEFCLNTILMGPLFYVKAAVLAQILTVSCPKVTFLTSTPLWGFHSALYSLDFDVHHSAARWTSANVSKDCPITASVSIHPAGETQRTVTTTTGAPAISLCPLSTPLPPIKHSTHSASVTIYHSCKNDCFVLRPASWWNQTPWMLLNSPCQCAPQFVQLYALQ